MLGEAKDNITKINVQKGHTKDLRDRFEKDFGYFRGEKFTIPKLEGEWESFTSNRATREANKIINTLAASWLKLSIPLSKETETQRKDLSATERFPYGAIALRDSLITGIPEALPLQAAMSWHSPVRGWLVLLCYLHEMEDGKNGKIRPHIAVWDILNTGWISGEYGLLWTSTMRYASPEDVKDRYKEDLKPDYNGRVTLHDVWDKDEHGVIGEGNWVLNPEEHGLKHVPVLILPGGSTPFIQSEKYTDTIKNVGESWAVNNRNLYDTENEMGSYMKTLSGRVAKTPLAHEWDSTKTQGARFPALENSPFVKGSEVPLDVGKGEKMYPLTPPELTPGVFSFFNYLVESLDLGGQSPLPPTAGPAAGLNIKRHEAEEKMRVARQLMERGYQWLGHELVSQFKNGGFTEGMEIQGIDGRNQVFKMEVKPEDIDDSWQFKAELISNFPQDQQINTGMAVQLHESELLSDETIRDKYLYVEDTDLEQQKLDREQAYKMHFINARHLAAVLADKGDTEGAQFILADIEKMKMEMMAQPQPGVAPQAGVPSPVRPSADTTAVAPPPPTPKSSALNRFRSRFGG